MRSFPEQIWAYCNDCTLESITFTEPFLGSKHWPLINDTPSVFFLDCKLSTSECMECHMHGSVEQRYSRPCTTACDQEDFPWRMMVKVVSYRCWDTITLVHYWKFLLGRVPSVLSNIKRTPSKVLLMVVFVLILLQCLRTLKSSKFDRCSSVIDLLLPPL